MQQLSLFNEQSNESPQIELTEQFEAYFACRSNKQNTINAFLSSMNSYLGIMKHYKTYKLRKMMLFKNLSGWWWNYVYLSGGIAKFVLRQKATKCYHGHHG